MKLKEEPPGREAPGPPPSEVIDLCPQAQGEEDSYMPEQIAGVKRRPEAEAETPASDDEDNQEQKPPKEDNTLAAKVNSSQKDAAKDNTSSVVAGVEESIP
ncbi:hypothetical protein PF003_g24302 [Phytophthora fragariae]|nr:hypothetical protein PF003_g24302 [Phytophthora fragariae]